MEEQKQVHEQIAEEECEVYCGQCKKLVIIKAGQPIPHCCGKVMEIFD